MKTLDSLVNSGTIVSVLGAIDQPNDPNGQLAHLIIGGLTLLFQLLVLFKRHKIKKEDGQI